MRIQDRVIAALLLRLTPARHRKLAVIHYRSPTASALARMLEDLDFQVIVVESRQACLSVLALERPDVAFVDAASLASDARLMVQKDERRTVYIACTNGTNSQQILRALSDNRSDDYLISPFDKTVLISKLRCLGLVEQREAAA